MIRSRFLLVLTVVAACAGQRRSTEVPDMFRQGYPAASEQEQMSAFMAAYRDRAPPARKRATSSPSRNCSGNCARTTPDDAVPVDALLVQSDAGTRTLLLPRGEFRLVARDAQA